jgi:hypothetical protein
MGAILQKAFMISAFVAVMMILVEYVNVLTEGRWRSAVSGSRWREYLIAAVLGTTPGCLGAFIVVALYIHRGVGLGAVVACMIATSGDESFVMLALFPGTAALVTLGLAATGVIAGAATDTVVPPVPSSRTVTACCRYWRTPGANLSMSRRSV